MNFYFIQCVMILFYHYFDAKIFLVTDLTFQTGSFVLLTYPQSFCKNFPTFWDKKMFQAHLVFTLVQVWNQPCLQESFFVFLVENGMQKPRCGGLACSLLLKCHCV